MIFTFHPAGDEGEDEARVDVKVSSYSQPGSTGKRARGSTLLCTGCPLEVMLSVQTVTPPNIPPLLLSEWERPHVETK